MENKHEDALRVTVHYMAAGQPFKDDSVERTETVGHLKQRVLAYFSLAEGQTPDGGNTMYTLYHDKTPLDNPNLTLGEIAGNQKILQLKLIQQVTQG